MPKVRSNMFSDIDHNPETSTMTIRFHTGNRYTIQPVTAEDYKEFIGASSIGKYYNLHIKNNPRFKVTPLPEEEGETAVA